MSEEAVEIVEHLAEQAQLLATLKTLGTLHVFASIPFERVADIQTVAHVLGLPYDHLLRLIRFVAISGFLHEPQPGFVEHTALSTQLVRKPILLDAIKFISDTALPAALQTTPRTNESLGNEKQHDWKWKRQVDAYQRLRQDTMDNSVTEILSDMQWADLGNATIVQIGPPSTTTARKLASENPNLSFIVQMPEKSIVSQCNGSKSVSSGTASFGDLPITVAYRSRGEPQAVRDAHVYILYLPRYSASQKTTDVSAEIAAELRTNLDVLRCNPNARLLLVAELLPSPGTMDTKAEAAARTRDLLLMQLTNGGLFGMEQLQEIVNNTRDEKGGLHIAKYMPSRHMPVTVAQVVIKDC